MSQFDNILDETPEAAPRRPLVLRLVVWAAMALCATLIATVLLSDPFLASRVHDAADTLSMRLENWRTSELAEATEIPVIEETNSRPATLFMPSDRVPVRRAGIAAAD